MAEQSWITAMCFWICASSGDCGTVVVAQEDNTRKTWCTQNHTQLLCSAKLAMLFAMTIATKPLPRPRTRTLTRMVTTGSPAGVKITILIFNIQKLKSCLSMVVKRRFWRNLGSLWISQLNLFWTTKPTSILFYLEEKGGCCEMYWLCTEIWGYCLPL